MTGWPGPRLCAACRPARRAATCIDGADLCRECTGLAAQLGENGLLTIMRHGPEMVRRNGPEAFAGLEASGGS